MVVIKWTLMENQCLTACDVLKMNVTDLDLNVMLYERQTHLFYRLLRCCLSARINCKCMQTHTAETKGVYFLRPLKGALFVSLVSISTT